MSSPQGGRAPQAPRTEPGSSGQGQDGSRRRRIRRTAGNRCLCGRSFECHQRVCQWGRNHASLLTPRVVGACGAGSENGRVRMATVVARARARVTCRWCVAAHAHLPVSGIIRAHSTHGRPLQDRRWFPSCPLHALTGLLCPLCGSLRALHALLVGAPVVALFLNPLTTSVAVAGFVACVHDVACPARAPLGERLAALWFSTPGVACAIAFGVLRNVNVPFAWMVH